MSERSIRVMTCDRCFDEAELRRDHEGYVWGRITAAQSNGHLWIGSQDGKVSKDICPRCMEALMTWWRKPLDDHEAMQNVEVSALPVVQGGE